MASEPLRPPSHCCRWPGAPRSDGAPRPLPRSCPECRRRSCRNWLVVGFLLVSPFPPSFLPPSLSCREVPWKVLVLRKYQGQIKGRSTVWVSKPSSSQFIRKCFGEQTPFNWLVLALSPPFVHLIEGSPVTSYLIIDVTSQLSTITFVNFWMDPNFLGRSIKMFSVLKFVFSMERGLLRISSS